MHTLVYKPEFGRTLVWCTVYSAEHSLQHQSSVQPLTVVVLTPTPWASPKYPYPFLTSATALAVSSCRIGQALFNTTPDLSFPNILEFSLVRTILDLLLLANG